MNLSIDPSIEPCLRESLDSLLKMDEPILFYEIFFTGYPEHDERNGEKKAVGRIEELRKQQRRYYCN